MTTEQVQLDLFDSPYYNTTGESGEKLKEYKEITAKQDLEVLALYRHYKTLSPSECWHVYSKDINSKVPITSIRRSINTLTNLGYLEKTDEKQIGYYGRSEIIWKLLK